MLLRRISGNRGINSSLSWNGKQQRQSSESILDRCDMWLPIPNAFTRSQPRLIHNLESQVLISRHHSNDTMCALVLQSDSDERCKLKRITTIELIEPNRDRVSQNFAGHPTGQVPTISSPNTFSMKAFSQLSNHVFVALAVTTDEAIVEAVECMGALRGEQGDVASCQGLSNGCTQAGFVRHDRATDAIN